MSRSIARACLRGRRPTLPVMRDFGRQAQPGMHRFLPDRVARRRERARLECAHRDPAHCRVAVAFPIQSRAATRAEVKTDAFAAVGVALKDLALALEPLAMSRARGRIAPPAGGKKR